MDNYEQWMASQAGRFSTNFYTIHNHYNDPNYPYTCSADMIAAANSNPPVVMMKKTAGFPTLTNARPSTAV
jgi:hypothetical protein